MYRLFCHKPAHFLASQIAVLSSKCSVLIVLGTYNFGEGITSHLITEQRILRGFGRDL